MIALIFQYENLAKNNIFLSHNFTIVYDARGGLKILSKHYFRPLNKISIDEIFQIL